MAFVAMAGAVCGSDFDGDKCAAFAKIGAALCTLVMAMATVVGDDGNNVINLSTVTGAFFNPNLEIIVDGDDGDDVIAPRLLLPT